MRAFVAAFTRRGAQLGARIAKELGAPLCAPQRIAESWEISTHPVDLRGMIAALRLMEDGMNPRDAIAMGITNKCFDEYEHQLVQDVVATRFG